MLEHTLPKGYNAVATFLEETEQVRLEQISMGGYRFRKDELAEKYRSWIIKPGDYREFHGPRETHGEPRHSHYIVEMIAQQTCP